MSTPPDLTLDLSARGGAPPDSTIDLTSTRPRRPSNRPSGPTSPAPAPPEPSTTGLSTPELAALPEATWRDDTGTPFALMPARVGIHLGTGREDQPVALPCPGPAGNRIAVLGEPLFGRLVALRLLATGAMVTAATGDPGPWQSMRRAAGDRLAFADDPAAWPRHTPAPPGVDAGPQALVSDQRRAPSSAVATGPWRTVIHVTREAPRGAAFWQRPDVLLALGADHAEAVGRLLGPEAARLTSQLSPGEIVLFRPAATEILRPDIAPGENALLTPAVPSPR
jgi:hypothetical protein